jgi:hypothetical protein
MIKTDYFAPSLTPEVNYPSEKESELVKENVNLTDNRHENGLDKETNE